MHMHHNIQATVQNHAYAIINTQPVLPLCLQGPQHC